MNNNKLDIENAQIFVSLFVIVFIIYGFFRYDIYNFIKRLFKKTINFFYIEDDKRIGVENVLLLRLKNWLDSMTLCLKAYIKNSKKNPRRLKKNDLFF